MAVELDGTHLADPEFWAGPTSVQDELFTRLRAEGRPVYVDRSRSPGWSGGPGFFALTRYEQIIEVSRSPEVFSSEPSATSLDDPPASLGEYLGSMISTDDPRHARLRRIVSRAFTPRMIKKFEDDVATTAAGIVDDLVDRGPCDFVDNVATRLPLKIICAMLGIPDTEYEAVTDSTNILIGAIGDPDYVGPAGQNRAAALNQGFSHLHGLMHELAARRQAHPTDDLVTSLVSADVDGESLSEGELGRFFTLLVAAGNETTRNAISHALVLFTEHPRQRALLVENLDERLPAAVEEVVRYASPVRWMRRNLTRDHDLLGHTFRAGDRVVLYYNSANRDESIFPAPETFDITRSPNPHLGFGGPGPHFCLGAHLARREVAVILRELLTRTPDIHATAEPVRLPTSFINGIKELPCAF